MSEHPTESLAAFALGVLDASEATIIAAHLRRCAGCRAEVEQFQQVVGLLPYSSPPQQPPAHIKQQLLARIRVMQPETVIPPAPRPQPWLRAALLLLLVVLVGLGAYAFRPIPDAAQPAVVAFLASPQTIGHPMQSSQPGVYGTMYLQHGQRRVVLVVQGLAPPVAGRVYQCWFAAQDRAVPLRTFTVDDSGTA